jgi:hypothetical protein
MNNKRKMKKKKKRRSRMVMGRSHCSPCQQVGICQSPVEKGTQEGIAIAIS